MGDDSAVDKKLSGPGSDPAARNVADEPRIATLLAEAGSLGLARLDAEVLLQALLRRSRAELLAFGETPVDPVTAAMFRASVARRAAGEPLAYITGIREFWSLPLVVTPAVLVPRPETELLVERCLEVLGSGPRQVADLGTGSGAIALALARERPAWRIVATDLSEDALEIARINRQRLRVTNLEFRHGHWCEPLAQERFDAIVSNPPYIEPGHPALAELRHEPVSALVAQDDGLADLAAIADGAREHLAAGGLLMLEHGAEQAGRLARELTLLGYARPVCHTDAAGRDRVTIAVWPSAC